MSTSSLSSERRAHVGALVAPTQKAPIVRERDGKRELAMLRWGLIPYWSKDAKIAYKTINARAETVATAPSFREAFRARRCLIPTSGFYEWLKTPGGKHRFRGSATPCRRQSILS
jgi:putative SOS response-associated peptidase YedK